MYVYRIVAFSDGSIAGNPAGVVFCEEMPAPSVMQRIAAEVGYSETAFASPLDGGWRVRYFAPEMEVPFCGHATIALGVALALRKGDGTFNLTLNDPQITVEGKRNGSTLAAALQSPRTRSEALSFELLSEIFELFSLTMEQLEPGIPAATAYAGTKHAVIAVNSLEHIRSMRYELPLGRTLMRRHGFTTIILAYAQAPQIFPVRNAFASGGVYEDPATGAAAAALGGYLRGCGWPHGVSIDIRQGDQMGIPCRIRVEVSKTQGQSVKVAGLARLIEQNS